MKKIIYALGYFDGVHLGHQALLAACRDLAQQQKCLCGAVTFLGHPETLLLGTAPGLINTPDDRKKLLQQQFHMDSVVELPFDEVLMATSWQDFLTDLVENYGAAGFVCGTDFRFGKSGQGTAKLLQAFCRENNLACCMVEQQFLDGIRVSSTHIRSCLEAGKIREANRFLGHPYMLTGVVQSGKQLGRTIGIPTANLSYPDPLLHLPYGVYACKVHFDGKAYPAVTNIGVRPTVSGKGITVESHLLDFSGDLYGKTVEISFYDFIRPEQKFSDLTQLKAQIKKDMIQTKKILAK
jgi:riboflavin kinase/FMN adenylyltransferase